MFSTLFLIGVFLLAFRWFAPKSVWTISAGIPCVMIAGLFATNFFEPAAQAFARPSGPFAFLGTEADCVLFLIIFLGMTAILCNLMAAFPGQIRLPESFELQARLCLSALASYLVMAVTLTAFDLSPRGQWILGLSPQSRPLLGLISPDAQWLDFVAVTSEGSLSRSRRMTLVATDNANASALVTAAQHIRTVRERYVPIPINPNENH